MKEIPQFEPRDLTPIMEGYFTLSEQGNIALVRELCGDLNKILRDKAEASREQEELARPPIRPNCF